jgi:hypothetical protein
MFSGKVRIKKVETISNKCLRLELFEPIRRVIGGEEKEINIITISSGNISKDNLQPPEGGYLVVKIKSNSDPVESYGQALDGGKTLFLN